MKARGKQTETNARTICFAIPLRHAVRMCVLAYQIPTQPVLFMIGDRFAKSESMLCYFIHAMAGGCLYALGTVDCMVVHIRHGTCMLLSVPCLHLYGGLITEGVPGRGIL